MATINIRGFVVEVERDAFTNVFITEGGESLFKCSVNSRASQDVLAQVDKVSEKDYVEAVCFVTSKKNDKGYTNVGLWINSLQNFTREFNEGQGGFNEKIKQEQKRQADPEDDNDAPWED